MIFIHHIIDIIIYLGLIISPLTGVSNSYASYKVKENSNKLGRV